MGNSLGKGDYSAAQLGKAAISKVESIKVDSLVKFVDKRTWRDFRVVAINAASKKAWLETIPTPVNFDEIDLVEI